MARPHVAFVRTNAGVLSAFFHQTFPSPPSVGGDAAGCLVQAGLYVDLLTCI